MNRNKRRFKIVKLRHPVPSGDWHDKPMKWEAQCLTDWVFTQKFVSKRDAKLWARCASTGTWADTQRIWDGLSNH